MAKKKKIKEEIAPKMTIKEAVETSNQRWKEKGGKLTMWHCAFHNGLIETRQPSVDDVTEKGYWDSAKICPNCGEASFVTLFPNGKTHSVPMGENIKKGEIYVFNPGFKEVQVVKRVN
jgi:hypothetical protein